MFLDRFDVFVLLGFGASGGKVGFAQFFICSLKVCTVEVNVFDCSRPKAYFFDLFGIGVGESILPGSMLGRREFLS